MGIQDSFEAQIDKLRNLDYTVLDVKTSRWHDDYNSFKDVVKDLEVRGPQSLGHKAPNLAPSRLR